ncbi:MAG: hypothetical protein AAGF11_32205 [Myxococcota bacterium]
MPRPLRPSAGRWSLVAAVLLPSCDGQTASSSSSSLRIPDPTTGPEHATPSSTDDASALEPHPPS